MADQAGLNSAPRAPAGAGLADDPTMTMGERFSAYQSLSRGGYTPAEIEVQLGWTPSITPAGEQGDIGDEGGMGAGELLFNYGPRTAISGAFEGLSGMAEDHIGDGFLSDKLDDAADFVGPTAEQEAARAKRGEGKGILGSAADGIMQEAGFLGGTIAAGAAAGSIVPGAGTLIGGIIGGGVGIARMYDQGRDNVIRGKIAEQTGRNPDEITAEEIQASNVELTKEERGRVAAVGALGALDAFPATKVLKALRPNAVAKAAQRSLVRGALKEGGKTGVQEGLMEVGQELGTMALTDAELRKDIAKLPKKDILSIGALIGETHGEELAISFLAGFGLGGAAGAGAGGASAQYAKKQVTDATAIAKSRNVDIPALEEIISDPARAGEFQEGMAEINQGQRMVQQAEKGLADAKGTDAKIEAQALLDNQNKKLGAQIDRFYGKDGLNVSGFKSTSDMAAERKAAEQERLDTLGETQSAVGLSKPRNIDTKSPEGIARVEELTRGVTEADSDLNAAQAKLSEADPKSKKYGDKKRAYEDAVAKAADARANYEGAAIGADAAKVKKDFISKRKADDIADQIGSEVEARVADFEEDILASADPVARAKAIKRSAKKKGADAPIRKNLNAAKAELRKAESSGAVPVAEMRAIRNKIAGYEAQLGTANPAVLAADRVLQAQEGDQEGAQSPSLGGEAAAGDTAPAPTEVSSDTKSTTPQARKPKAKTAEDGVEAEPSAATISEDAGQKVLDAKAAKRNAPRGDIEAGQNLDQAAQEVLEAAGVEPTEANIKKIATATTSKAMQNRLSKMPIATPAPAAAAAGVDAVAAPQEDFDLEALKSEVGQNDGREINRQYRYRWKNLINDLDLKVGDKAEVTQKLRAWTKENGREASATFDAKGNLIAVGTNNNANGVHMPKHRFADAVDATHTHPFDTPMSVADVRVVAAMQMPFSAILPNGQEVTILPTKGTTVEAIDALEREVYGAADGSVREGLGTVEKARVYQEAFLQAADELGIIEYSAPQDGFNQAEQKEIRNAVKGSITSYSAGNDVNVGLGAAPVGEDRGPVSETRTSEPGETGGEISETLPVAAAIDPFGPDKKAPSRDPMRGVNVEAVRALGQQVFDAIPAGKAGVLRKARNAGEITPETVANTIGVLIDNHGQNAGLALRNAGQWVFGPNAEGKTDQDRHNMALVIMNEVSKSGAGKFSRDTSRFYDPAKKDFITVASIMADKKLRTDLQAETSESSFTPPMSDPDDVSNIFNGKANIILSGPALERAENTAKMLQRHRYTINQDKVSAMTAEDLMSSKSIPKNDGHRDFLLRAAQKKLDRLRDMAERWGDKELGFSYFIDKKGRLYPRGEFHHQSGNVIKGAFTASDGRSLSEYNSIDHTGSGWQIAGAISGDEVLAPLVNLQAGTAEMTGVGGKGDIYTATKDAIAARLEKVEGAQPFIDKVINNSDLPANRNWNGKGGRNLMKTPVIAVNYAGESSNFRTALMNGYYQDFKKGELPDGFWHTAADVAYDAVGDIAPNAKAFKDWAVTGLRQAVAAADAKGAPLTITVGPDGAYQIKKRKSVPVNVLAQDNREGSAIKKVEQSFREPTGDIDVNKTARNMYSQIVQGWDAAIMHETARRYQDATDGGFLVTNHDSYTVPPENSAILAASVRGAMRDTLSAVDVGAQLRQEILDQTGVDIGQPPAKGSWTTDSIETASPTFVEDNELTGQLEERPAYAPIPEGDFPQIKPRDRSGDAVVPVAQGIDYSAADAGSETGVPMVTSLPKAADFAQSQSFNRGRELKVALQAQALASQAEAGIDLTALTPENVDRLSDFVVEDAQAAMVDNSNAIGWYGRTVTKAKETLAEIYPEILTDPEAEFKFTWALAVTSNGLKVDKNFELAAQAYDTLKETGRFPTKVGIGNATSAINNGLGLYQDLVDKLGGWEAARDFMVERQPVRDIEKTSGVKVSGESKRETLPGAVILGPKIGGGFFSNLYGNFDELTMDRWFMRTVGRWRGSLIESNPEMVKKKQNEIKGTLKSLSPAEMKEVKRLFDGSGIPIRKTMTNAQIDAFSVEIAKRSMKPAWRNEIKALVGGEAIRKSGNGLAKYLDGQVEQPATTKERTFLRDVFRKGLARLQENPDMTTLTMSDLQALLWYPEKTLYDTVKQPIGEEAKGYSDEDAPDYANAARKLVDNRLGQAGSDGQRGRSPVGRTGDAGPSSGGAQVAIPVAAGIDVAIGLDVQAESALGQLGVESLTPAQMQPVIDAAAEASGVTVTPAKAGKGGWFNPDTQRIESEASTIAEVEGAPDQVRAFAAMAGKALGQYSVLTTAVEADGSGNGHVVRVNGADPEVLFEIANKAAPEAFTGFSGTENGATFFVPLDATQDINTDVQKMMEALDNDPRIESFETGIDGATGEFVEGGTDGEGYTSTIRDVLGDDAASEVDSRLRGVAEASISGDAQGGTRGNGEGAGPADLGQGAIPVAAGIDEMVGVKPTTTDTALKNQIRDSVIAGRKTPNAALAHLRHSSLLSYDRLMNEATQADGMDYGPQFFAAHADFTKGLGAKLAGLSRGLKPDAANFYLEMIRAQKNDHISKLLLGIERGAISVRDVDPKTRTYKGTGGTGVANALTDRIAAPMYREAIPFAMGFDMSRYKSAEPKRGIAKPTEDRPLSRLANALDAGSPQPVFKAVSDWLGRKKRAGARQIFNERAGLNQLEDLAGHADALMHQGMSRMAQMMANSTGRIAAMMQHGAPKWDAKELLFKYADGTKGLAEIFTFKNSEDYQNFQGYAYAVRDRALMAAGKGARMTDDLRAEYESITADEKQRYDVMLEDYRKFNEALINMMHDTGLINRDRRDALISAKEYVPMQREFADSKDFGLQEYFGQEGGFNHPDPGIQALTDNPPLVDGDPNGEGGVFGDLLSSIQKNAAAVMVASSQNLAHKKIYDFMSQNLPEEVRKKVRARKLGRKEKKKALKSGAEDAVTFREDGEEFVWRIEGDDPEWTGAIQMALAGLSPRQLNGFDQIMKGFNGFQRDVITGTPAFAMASVVRDAGQAYVQSGINPAKILSENARQYREAITGMSQETKDLMMSAGIGGYQLQGMPKNDAASFRKKTQAQEAGAWDNTKRVLSEYQRIVGSSEMGARKAVHDTIAAREGVSAADAAYEGLNLIDFGQKGASGAVQSLTQMVLFLNPRLQGLYRLSQTTAGETPRNRHTRVARAILARGMMVMFGSMALRALTSMSEEDEEKYDRLTQQEKAGYWHLPTFGASEKMLRIPKPFEVGAVFGTLPVQWLWDSPTGEGANAAAAATSYALMETFSLNPTPAVFKPIAELLLNKSMYTGRDIEGQAQMSRAKEFRADERTGYLAKQFGNKVLSPIQLQHLANGYLGPLGMLGYAAADATAAGLTGTNLDKFGSMGALRKSAGQVSGVGASSRFTSKAMDEGSIKQVSEYYDLKKTIEQYQASIKDARGAGDMEMVEDLSNRVEKFRVMKGTIASANKMMLKLNKQRRAILSSPEMSSAQREEALSKNRRKRNEIVEKVMKKARSKGITGGFLGGFVGLGVKV